MPRQSFDTFIPGLDDAEVLALRATVWGGGHGTPAFFDWLFARNPSGRGMGTMLRRDGRLVGFAGLAPRTLHLLDRDVTIAHGLDDMVHPTYRGSIGGDVAMQLARDWPQRAKAARYPLAINFPDGESARLLTSDVVGWTSIVAPSLLVRPLRGLRFGVETPGRLPPWLATLGGRALAAALALRPRPRLPAGCRIVEVAQFDNRFDALWARARGGRIALSRDAAHLNWRYVGHPAYSYRTLAVERGDAVLAFMVASPRHLMGLDSLLVVDAWSAPGDAAMLRVLLAEVAKRATREGVGMLGAQAAPGSAVATLRGAGFVPVPERLNPKPFVLVGLPLEPGCEAALRPDPWHLTWGDMDVV